MLKTKAMRILGVALIMVVATTGVAVAIDLGDILLGGGVVLLVREFADEINKGINTLTLNKGLASELSTKVVPVVTVGRRVTVGAAQVTGTPDRLARVRAVGQLGADIGDLRGYYYFPASDLNPVEADFVEDVGVTALIDMRI